MMPQSCNSTQKTTQNYTFTRGTANEAGMNEKAMLTIIAAEKESRSCKIQTIIQSEYPAGVVEKIKETKYQ